MSEYLVSIVVLHSKGYWIHTRESLYLEKELNSSLEKLFTNNFIYFLVRSTNKFAYEKVVDLALFNCTSPPSFINYKKLNVQYNMQVIHITCDYILGHSYRSH